MIHGDVANPEGENMQKVIEKYRYELMFSVVLLAYLMYYIPVIDELTSWTITPYALNYDFGFISRGFIGSIIRLVIPNLTIKHIYIIILMNTLLLCGLTLYFMHKMLIKAYDESKSGIIFLLGLFLVNPGSVAFLFYWGNYGRFDMYLIASLIITALLLIYDKCVWIIPFLCVGAVMTHQAFVFQYFPAVLILLFYSSFVLKRKYGKSIFVFTLVATCAMFLYMQFFSEIKYGYEDTMAILNATTDLPAEYFEEDMMVKIEYYSSVFETFVVFVREPFVRNVVKSVTMLVFLIPMIKILVEIWKNFVKSHKNIICKSAPWFVLLAEVPMFVLTCDYGRDYAAIVLSNFVLIFALYAMGDEGMKAGVKELTEKMQQNPLYYGFVIVLCAALSKFTASDISDIGHRLYTLIVSFIF